MRIDPSRHPSMDEPRHSHFELRKIFKNSPKTSKIGRSQTSADHSLFKNTIFNREPLTPISQWLGSLSLYLSLSLSLSLYIYI